MHAVLDHPLADGRTARLRFTGVADGDLRIAGPACELAARRRAIVDLPWTWLRQVHGAHVVRVRAPGDAAGEPADGAVTTATGAVLAVHTADCVPVALVADGGGVGVAHAGWRGLLVGVVPAAVDALRTEAGAQVRAWVGPRIGPECYEFGPDELAKVVAALGPEVAGETSAGRPALDLATAVGIALTRAGVDDVVLVGGCTACGPDAYSHRARGDRGRQAALAWIEP